MGNRMDLLTILFMFFVYCLIGWVWESIYESILNKKILNRGFLNGPYIPLYGFGGLIILLFLQRFQTPFMNIMTVKIYFIGAIGATVLEYVTSYVLEKILKARWWDYSEYPLNLNGRICLIATVFWGVVAVAAIDFINPFLLKFYSGLSHDTVLIYVTAMCTLFILDLVVTINSILDLRNRMQLLISLEKDKITDSFAEKIGELGKYKEKLSLIGNPFTRRILRSFPKLKFSSDVLQKTFVKIKNFRMKKDDED